MARDYPYDTTPQSLFHPAQGKAADDFFQDWSDADKADLPLFCAELSRLAYGDEALVAAALPRAGLTLLKWLGGGGISTRFKTWGTDGFVAGRAGGATFVVFRGTEAGRVEDIIADLRARQVVWPSGGLVHEGFAVAYTAISQELAAAMSGRGGTLVFTGHSLGAALATLAASSYRQWTPTLVTFGSPRAGDATFAATLASQVTVHRYVGCCDIVTRVPPEVIDQANVQDVLHPLLGDGLLADGFATTLPKLLAIPLSGVCYRHCGELTYIDRAGTVHAPKVDAAFIAADQATARKEYGIPPFVGGLTQAFFQAQLSAGHGGGRVPYRDLADHAPINYVGPLARRRNGV